MDRPGSEAERTGAGRADARRNRIRILEAAREVRPRVEVLLQRAQAAGAVRDDLRSEELIALLGALCQEAMADDWSEPLRRRALTILFEGMGPVAKS